MSDEKLEKKFKKSYTWKYECAYSHKFFTVPVYLRQAFIAACEEKGKKENDVLCDLMLKYVGRVKGKEAAKELDEFIKGHYPTRSHKRYWEKQVAAAEKKARAKARREKKT